MMFKLKKELEEQYIIGLSFLTKYPKYYVPTAIYSCEGVILWYNNNEALEFTAEYLYIEGNTIEFCQLNAAINKSSLHEVVPNEFCIVFPSIKMANITCFSCAYFENELIKSAILIETEALEDSPNYSILIFATTQGGGPNIHLTVDKDVIAKTINARTLKGEKIFLSVSE